MTIARLSELKPIMLASSVQAVVATAPRVCTLVLFILVGNDDTRAATPVT